MIYLFELCHNATEAAENIYCVKGEGILDDTTEIRWWNKFRSFCKNLDYQSMSGTRIIK